ncbi:MAG: RNA polymerase sigma factor [Sedimentisphaerales bacterium]|nr:RNA polymerase sigma factor [Sedimentisphaerales bacterium]
MAEKIDAEKHASNRRDELLVEQFRRGDKSAFERIVEQYSADVAALANRLLGWPGDVEDVTQDIFLAVFLGLKKFRCDCSLKSWLFTITINKCRSYRQKWKLRQLQDIPILLNGMGMRLPHTNTGVSPMNAEEFNRVRLAVAVLPTKYREPVVLRYLQELGTDEISRILGVSKNTLNVRLSRAKKRLKEDLAELIEQ